MSNPASPTRPRPSVTTQSFGMDAANANVMGPILTASQGANKPVEDDQMISQQVMNRLLEDFYKKPIAM